jgi:isoleucyl-tRNA synthetase
LSFGTNHGIDQTLQISNLYDFDPAKDLLPGDQLVALDRWAIVAAKQLQEKIITAYEEYHFQSIYQMVHNFCTVEMGSFYLDIIKDRLYTAASNSVARRSAQTAMYHILEAFVRWMAPILCYTADEIWEYIPGDREASVFLAEWYHGFDEVAVADDIDWGQLIPLRDAVNKVLETHRQAGEIGSGLDASVSVYANSSLYPELQKLQDELRFVLITSDAVAKPLEEAVEAASATDIEGVKVLVSVSPHEKCERCWQRREAVGQNAAHETLCERCVDNIDSDGEERQFA